MHVGDVWVVGAFSMGVLLSALGLIGWHVRAWHRWELQDLSPRERDYRRRQFRRRVQTSAMLALLGLGLFLGRWLMEFPVPPFWKVLYWSGLLLLLFWMGLLAGADAVATRLHFGRLHQDYLLEQTRLQAELRRAKRCGGNGRTERPPSD